MEFRKITRFQRFLMKAFQANVLFLYILKPSENICISVALRGCWNGIIAYGLNSCKDYSCTKMLRDMFPYIAP